MRMRCHEACSIHNGCRIWMMVLSVTVGITSGFVFHNPNPSSRIRSFLHPNQLIQQKQQKQLQFRKESSAFLNKNRQNNRWSNAFSSSSSSSSSNLFATSITNTDYDKECDVLVLGSGPAARAIASLVSSSSNIRVLLADENWDREWVPNYGTWKDEWESIVIKFKEQNNIILKGGNVGNAIDREWNVTDCFFGGSFDIPMEQRLRLDRPYYRVDKNALQKSLSLTNQYEMIYAKHISQAIGINIYSPSNTLLHDKDGTTIQLQMKDTRDIKTVRTKFLVDCTGHESSLILKDAISRPQNGPGYQIAYGALVDIDESNSIDTTYIGPYDKEAMTLFDYRTDHYDTRTEFDQQKLQNAPTFMYVMPITKNQVFFEETSLVARPGVSFQECKDRCYTRLEYLGIKVSKIHEEEFCYIPMGGSLPARDQRIITLGGSASMVHPATGYHLCRCLMGASDLSQVLINAFDTSRVNNNNNNNNININQIVASCYHSLWSPQNIMQRNFAVFGGEYLMKQNVIGLRGFFTGFFNLPMNLWSGFLAGWPGLPNNIYHESWYGRLWYGLNFIVRLPPQVSLDMLSNIISFSISEGLLTLPQTVMPFLGQPIGYEYQINQDRIGDVAAKAEGRQMILESQNKQDVPVDFIPLSLSDNNQKSISSSMNSNILVPSITSLSTMSPTKSLEIEQEASGSFQ